MANSNSFTCRDVRRAPGFDDAAAKIFGDLKRADHVLGAVEFVLARAPMTYSTAVSQSPTSVYLIKTRPARAWPAVALFYTCDDLHVTLLAIREADAYDGDA